MDFACQMDGENFFSFGHNAIFALTSHTHGNARFFRFENLSAIGEITIYNRDEIKKYLAIKDEISDGELLLWLYAKDDTKGFSLIEGMFVAAIYDGENLLMVRDAIGKKPLGGTYAAHLHGFAFVHFGTLAQNKFRAAAANINDQATFFILGKCVGHPQVR